MKLMNLNVLSWRSSLPSLSLKPPQKARQLKTTLFGCAKESRMTASRSKISLTSWTELSNRSIRLRPSSIARSKSADKERCATRCEMITNLTRKTLKTWLTKRNLWCSESRRTSNVSTEICSPASKLTRRSLMMHSLKSISTKRNCSFPLRSGTKRISKRVQLINKCSKKCRLMSLKPTWKLPSSKRMKATMSRQCSLAHAKM